MTDHGGLRAGLDVAADPQPLVASKEEVGVPVRRLEGGHLEGPVAGVDEALHFLGRALAQESPRGLAPPSWL